MIRIGSDEERNNHSNILMSMILSFLPIASAVWVFCFIIGGSLILLAVFNRDYGSAAVIFLTFAVIFAQLLGPMAYRFITRAFPLKASGHVDMGSLRILRRFKYLTLAAALGIVLFGWDLLSSLVNPANISDMFLGGIGNSIGLVISAIVLLFLACLAYGFIKAVNIHKQPRAWARDGFILFLRSFGSVADSAALGPLLRGSGQTLRVVLLSSPKELRTSWDPTTLALSGYSFRHPFISTPIYFRSSDTSWSDDVRSLASSARLVVIDISHQSPGLLEEVEILRASGGYAKIIQIEETSSRGQYATASSSLPGDVIPITRSPMMRRLSQTLGFTFTYIGFVTLTVVAVS